MRAVVQRVTKSRVTVEQETAGSINKGLVVLLGIGREDNAGDIEYLANKIVNLRGLPERQPSELHKRRGIGRSKPDV